MRTRRKFPHDFKGKRINTEYCYYDIHLDAILIEQSIAKQYGILPSAQPELPWWEWSLLVSGLMDDTPLGHVVAVRSETNPDRIKEFGPWQRRIRAEWQEHKAKNQRKTFDKAGWKRDMAALERMLAANFGGDEV